jgi:hypothetical protein
MDREEGFMGLRRLVEHGGCQKGWDGEIVWFLGFSRWEGVEVSGLA